MEARYGTDNGKSLTNKFWAPLASISLNMAQVFRQRSLPRSSEYRSPALFKRFKSKRQLMVAALAPPEVPPWVAALRVGPDDRPFRVQLEELAQGVTEYFREISPCMSVLSASGIPPKELMARFDTPPPIAAIRMLTGWLEQCEQNGHGPEGEFRGNRDGHAWITQYPIFSDLCRRKKAQYDFPKNLYPRVC